jgi:Cu(I)/Ag(I) efflux system membrane fusion protein
MRQFIKIVLLFLPLALLAKEANIEQLFSVVSVKVQLQKSVQSKKSYGYVKVDESRVYELTPRFGGYVEDLYADKLYSYVKKGEALASVYSKEVYKAKEEYINSYNYVQGRTNSGMLKSAKLKLELLGIPKSEIDSLLQSKNVPLNTTLYATSSGYLFAKSINKGSAFNLKQKLFEIVNLDEVWVEMKLFEDELSWVKNTESFEVSVKGLKQKYTTNSHLIYPKLDEKEATMSVRLSLKNKNLELFPGMYVSVISRDKAREYLTLPQSAVIRKNGKFYVFVITAFKGEYEPKEIKVSVLNAQTYIIESGLEVGDEVVNNALFMMDSDAQINGLY